MSSIKARKKLSKKLRKKGKATVPSGRPFTRPHLPADLYSGDTAIKRADHLFRFSDFDLAGDIRYLNALAQGTANYQRIGSRVWMKSLSVIGQIQARSAGLTAGRQAGRILVVYDRQPNGALPAISDVVNNVSNLGAISTVTQDVSSFQNWDLKDRFLILKDIRCTFSEGDVAAPLTGQIAGVVDYGNQSNLRFEVDLEGLQAMYNNPAALYNSVVSGGLLIMIWGDAVPPTGSFSVGWTARLQYTDVLKFHREPAIQFVGPQVINERPDAGEELLGEGVRRKYPYVGRRRNREGVPQPNGEEPGFMNQVIRFGSNTIGALGVGYAAYQHGRNFLRGVRRVRQHVGQLGEIYI